ncbi:MAG: hypothetical protein K5705_05200 [Oscillospiraceae bacterium]|nr:hypothetical protein [Oscillospiraceae bacterium]
MANDKIKSAAERDADAALEEILREVESAPRRRPRAEQDDTLDFVRTGTPRSHAATPRNTEPDEEEPPRLPVRKPRTAEGEMPQRRRPAQQSRAAADAEPVGQPRRATQRRPETAGEQRQAQRPRNPQQRSNPQRPQNPRNPEQRRRPQNAEGAQPVRRTRPAQEGGQTRNPQQRPAGTRSAADQHRRPQNGTRPAGARKKSAAAAKRQPNYWRIGMLIYIMLFIIGTLFAMYRLRIYLDEYEQSLPEHTIDGYVNGLNSGFYSDMVRQKVDQLAATKVTDYETADTIASTLDIENLGVTEYKWLKKSDEYTDERPVYYIRYGGASIATVALERAGGTQKFDFPIWKTCEAESLIEIASEAEYSVEVKLPAGGSLMVNGIEVPKDTFEDSEYEMPMDDVMKMYAEQPETQSVKISGLFVAPEVRAFDAEGNALEPEKVPADSVKEQIYTFLPADVAEPNEALVDRIEALTNAYINYMVKKDQNMEANWGALSPYLLRDADAHKTLLSLWADVNWNNPYTAREDKPLDVKHLKMYSEQLCTVEVSFDVQLTNAERGTELTNSYKGTVRWTLVKNGNTWLAARFETVSADGGSTDLVSSDEPAPAEETPAEDAAAPAEEAPVE